MGAAQAVGARRDGPARAKRDGEGGRTCGAVSWCGQRGGTAGRAGEGTMGGRVLALDKRWAG
jgi:hypothetical protein